MKITHETSHDEILRVLLKVRHDIQTSLDHMEQMNVGLAKEWAREARDKLPQDTDQGIFWMLFE